MRLKKIVDILRTTVAAATMMAGAGGCVIGTAGGETAPTGETTFVVTLPAALPVATRATHGENNIASMWILLCNADGVYEHKVRAAIVYRNNDSSTLEVKAAIPYRAEPYDLIFVANLPDPRLLDALTPGDDLALIGQKLVVRKTGDTSASRKWEVSGGRDNIPMYGQLKGLTIDGNRVTDPISLRRLLARVNVTVGVSDFLLHSVHVYNYTTAGNLVSDNPLDADAPSLPADPGTCETTDPMIYDAADRTRFENEIYLFENRHVARYGASGWEKNPCIVVGGRLDRDGDGDFAEHGDPTFYRLDFTNGTEWFDLVRNHSYNFEITAVSGPGYSSADEALKAPPRNIDGNILAWDDADVRGLDLNGPRYTIGVAEKTGGVAIAEYRQALAGMPVDIAAVPAPDYRFLDWSVANVNTGEWLFSLLSNFTRNPVTFIMPATNIRVYPWFERRLHTIELVQGRHADETAVKLIPKNETSAKALPGAEGVPAGTEVSYSVEWDAGRYSFEVVDVYDETFTRTETWLRDPNNITFTILPATADRHYGGRKVVAYINRLAPKTLVLPGGIPNLTLRGDNEAGTNALPGGPGVLPGTQVSITAVPATGYYINGWDVYPSIDAAYGSHSWHAGANLSFAMPAEGLKAQPFAEKIGYRVSVTSNAPGFWYDKQEGMADDVLVFGEKGLVWAPEQIGDWYFKEWRSNGGNVLTTNRGLEFYADWWVGGEVGIHAEYAQGYIPNPVGEVEDKDFDGKQFFWARTNLAGWRQFATDELDNGALFYWGNGDPNGTGPDQTQIEFNTPEWRADSDPCPPGWEVPHTYPRHGFSQHRYVYRDGTAVGFEFLANGQWVRYPFREPGYPQTNNYWRATAPSGINPVYQLEAYSFHLYVDKHGDLTSYSNYQKSLRTRRLPVRCVRYAK